MKKFKVGNVLRLSESNDIVGESGDIIKIIDVFSQPVADCEYTAIRGCKGGFGLFSITSEFASSLELLTKKEIGEAIRKWDADHAKKEPKYREVKRPAKVGEKIKIVNAHPIVGQHYSNGDIFEVKNSSGTSCTGDVIVFGIKSFIDFREYVVLEDYNPEQKEERRKAKVGDTIKVLRDNGGAVRAGTIWKVTNFSPLGSLCVTNEYWGGGFSVNSDNYVVISFGKHSYTEEQIDEAKKITLNMIKEFYSKSKGSILFSTNVINPEEGNAYVLKKDVSKLSSSSKGEITSITAEQVLHGVSKCSNNDEPNEWIGKCVALCKALHKPIPKFIMDGD
ncbi:MAG TPA: hypothetical protein DEB10_04735 [Ruminococcaceae bacterium]|nr:hypothetical protein [Oscillospiraceae bacterium]